MFYRYRKRGGLNIIKHSDADTVTLRLREHPAFYQMLIVDNGRGFGEHSLTAKVSGFTICGSAFRPSAERCILTARTGFISL